MLQACGNTEFCSGNSADDCSCGIYSIYDIDNIYGIYSIYDIQRHRNTCCNYTERTCGACTGIA